MATFAYVGVSGEGKRLEGYIDAGDARAAVSGVRGMGLTPISVRESTKVAKAWIPNLSLQLNRVTRKDILFFTEELSTLVRAGLPLDRSLKITAELAPKPALRKILEDVLTDIKSGKSLADALAAHPKQFTKLYVNMIRAGEAGGGAKRRTRTPDGIRTVCRRIAFVPGRGSCLSGTVDGGGPRFYRYSLLFRHPSFRDHLRRCRRRDPACDRRPYRDCRVLDDLLVGGVDRIGRRGLRCSRLARDAVRVGGLGLIAASDSASRAHAPEDRDCALFTGPWAHCSRAPYP